MNKVKIIVYSNISDRIQNFLKNLNNKNTKIIVENFEDFMMKDSYVNQGNLIIIENDKYNNGLELYKIIKDKVILENIPVVFIGEDKIDLKLEVYKLGALDFIEENLDKRILNLKLKKYIDIANKITLYSKDSLTGTFSSIYGEKLLQQEFEKAKMEKQNLCLLLIEIGDIETETIKLSKSEQENLIPQIIDVFKENLDNKDFIYRISYKRFMMFYSNKTIVDVLKIGNIIIQKIKKLAEENYINVDITGAIELLEEFNKQIDYFINKIIKRLETGKEIEVNKIYIEDVEHDYRKNSILILDEDKVLLKVLSSRYKNKGFDVKSLENVEEIESVLEKNNVDLIISNYIVSGFKVTEYFRELKEKYKKFKVLIYSSQANEYVVEEALSIGGDDYIEKPFSPIELDARVKKLMG